MAKQPTPSPAAGAGGSDPVRKTSEIQNSRANIPFAPPLDPNTSDLLRRIYNDKRINRQIEYYRNRVREFDANTGFMVSVGALIMAISTVVSAIGATSNSPALALVTAILPAIAALAASFRQLYQWEKQSTLYRDAVLGMEEVRLLEPDDDEFHVEMAPEVIRRMVVQAEKVFINEVSQWGQIALSQDTDGLTNVLVNLESYQQQIQQQSVEERNRQQSGFQNSFFAPSAFGGGMAAAPAAPDAEDSEETPPAIPPDDDGTPPPGFENAAG